MTVLKEDEVSVEFLALFPAESQEELASVTVETSPFNGFPALAETATTKVCGHLSGKMADGVSAAAFAARQMGPVEFGEAVLKEVEDDERLTDAEKSAARAAVYKAYVYAGALSPETLAREFAHRLETDRFGIDPFVAAVTKHAFAAVAGEVLSAARRVEAETTAKKAEEAAVFAERTKKALAALKRPVLP